jgi:uncharacterized Ntn-hydrolase superfamily protein
MTFSVTALCPRTGQLGVAVSTAIPGVGWFVPHGKSHIGAVASQALCNPYLGIWGLQLMEQGHDAAESLRRVLAADPEREQRQVAMVDVAGRSAAFTGAETVDWQGHRTGEGYAVAGNMLAGPAVVEEMAAAIAASASSALPLSERLLRALEAGQAAGGDKRGRQSAAIKVVAEEAFPYLDVRVDDHAEPIAELRRVVALIDARRSTVRYYSLSARDMGPVEGLPERR